MGCRKVELILTLVRQCMDINPSKGRRAEGSIKHGFQNKQTPLMADCLPHLLELETFWPAIHRLTYHAVEIGGRTACEWVF
jgi:hypothetical protein